MSGPLAPVAPLTEVRFVHDYLQLVFEGECFSIFNRSALKHDGTTLLEGEPGFTDSLISLIGQRATTEPSGLPLSIMFENGDELRVLVGIGNEGGPEAFQFSRDGNLLIVEQNT